MFSDYEDPLSSRGKPPKKPARKPVGQKRKFASKLVPRHSSRWVIISSEQVGDYWAWKNWVETSVVFGITLKGPLSISKWNRQYSTVTSCNLQMSKSMKSSSAVWYCLTLESSGAPVMPPWFGCCRAAPCPWWRHLRRRRRSWPSPGAGTPPCTPGMLWWYCREAYAKLREYRAQYEAEDYDLPPPPPEEYEDQVGGKGF